MNPETTRFAPSPTGYLHLGHAYSALFAQGIAQKTGGQFLLRIEDIDITRCSDAFEAAIFEDLAWLGLSWETPAMRQNARHPAYRAALDRLEGLGVLYPCFCTRREINAEIERAASAPQQDAPHSNGLIDYPGTCRKLSDGERQTRMASGVEHALRLDAGKAAAIVGPLEFVERERGLITVDQNQFGDVVLARKDIGTSYHLSVTLDDADQRVTLVTRGIDLFPVTHLHRVLQALLGLDTPEYHHHPMIEDSAGVRLAKRNDALSLRHFRDQGLSPDAVRNMVGLPD
ncbi:MAG: tRNA glutamyl-Q(34) synthetase GluQRS [Alphaproteobacteria bacterium]|jgi:glutamyl-Q tRNA(Asp) synthetase